MKQKGRTGLIVLPPDKGRNSANLIGVFHRGGGWYAARCFGGAKKCKAGECKHVSGLVMKGPASERPVKPEARP